MKTGVATGDNRISRYRSGQDLTATGARITGLSLFVSVALPFRDEPATSFLSLLFSWVSSLAPGVQSNT